MTQKHQGATELYEKGMSIADTARFYGITRQAMWMILKRRGVRFRSNLKYGEKNHFHRGTTAEGRVHDMTELALEKRVIARPELCQECKGRGNALGIQAHHADYNKPLEINWLCQPCHYRWHEKNSAIPLKNELPKMSRTEIARAGGVASAKKMTPEQRRARAEKSAKARWKK